MMARWLVAMVLMATSVAAWSERGVVAAAAPGTVGEWVDIRSPSARLNGWTAVGG